MSGAAPSTRKLTGPKNRAKCISRHDKARVLAEFSRHGCSDFTAGAIERLFHGARVVKVADFELSRRARGSCSWCPWTPISGFRSPRFTVRVQAKLASDVVPPLLVAVCMRCVCGATHMLGAEMVEEEAVAGVE